MVFKVKITFIYFVIYNMNKLAGLILCLVSIFLCSNKVSDVTKNVG